jgi:hypothetical protein
MDIFEKKNSVVAEDFQEQTAKPQSRIARKTLPEGDLSVNSSGFIDVK